MSACNKAKVATSNNAGNRRPKVSRVKEDKTKIKYPCGVCGVECRDDTIQCAKCRKWVHRLCTKIDEKTYAEWANSRAHFFCEKCVCDTPSGVFNMIQALDR